MREVKVAIDGEVKMRVRDWLLLLLLTGIPIIGWIVLIVGIYSKKSPTEKVVFCKAYLLFQVILLVISIILSYISIQVITTVFEYFIANIMG